VIRGSWIAKVLSTLHWQLATVLKTSADFLLDKERLLYLAEVAKRSHCRPSELLELTGTPAYLLDCTTAEAVAAHERNAAEKEEGVVEW
jgi:hypothetical protein